MTSGWCPPDGHSAAQHRVCQMRQNEPDPRIRLAPCGCGEHGGHEKPTVERESRPGAIGSETQSGPESALTDRGLATVSTTAKGA